MIDLATWMTRSGQARKQGHLHHPRHAGRERIVTFAATGRDARPLAL